MPDFLLELLSEEIPARMQAKARADLARLFAEQLAAAGLYSQGIETYATPRRLVLIARGLPAETAAVIEEIKGPRANAPPQALEGFLRKTGLAREQLVERDGVLFAVAERPGRTTASLLAEAVPAIVRAFPWPKSMRWGAASIATDSVRWVRPLQGIVALFGEDIVEFEAAGVASGAATVGHRFHHPGIITIGSANDYLEKLRACHVIVDQDERRRLIAEGAAAAAAAAGLTLVEDEGLLDENAGLTEWPVPLLGSFDSSFLEVPREVIQLTMRTNQKYFALTDGEGKLAPNFICTANIEASDGGASIVGGNERVLSARLSDAKFFWEQDLKVPLEEQAKKLSQIVFHEKLGTVADKVERVAKLARWLVEEGIVEGADPDQAERAARLAKADLVTGMVGEFPELQGIIGGYLARAQGESDEVADAIRDHYKPVGQGDEVPTSPITVAVSLADKLDTLFEFFAINEKPTGSKDPFALRRSAVAVLALLLRNNSRIGFENWYPSQASRSLWSAYTRLQRAVIAKRVRALGSDARPEEVAAASILVWPSRYDETANSLEELEVMVGEAVIVLTDDVDRPAGAALDQHMLGCITLFDDFLDFFADRLKVQQREAGVRHDLIDAVFALGGEDDLVRLLARVKALQAFVETPEGTDLLAGYKRAANILKKEAWTGSASVPPRHPELAGDQNRLSYTPENEEAALIAALDAAEPKAQAAVEAEDFEGAMAALASLRRPVDNFFDKVTVNDPDPVKREARLNLLMRMRDAVHRVADFSKIEG